MNRGKEIEIEEIKELVANKKFTTLKRKLEEMNSADISEILDELEDKESVIIKEQIPKPGINIKKGSKITINT